MFKYYSTQTKKESAILVGVAVNGTPVSEVEDHLQELEQLADTAGATVTDRIIQSRPSIDPTTYIGKGKVEEIEHLMEMRQTDLIIFDEELSPKQVRNLETKLNCKIMDRTGLILDIFASHAKTNESKTQVELAQLEYMLPRLTRLWTHLSKQKGGIGTKGPGETQIETDRRIIRERIITLKRKLDKISTQKTTQRKSRNELDQVALVGYTNAGKSTVMRLLSHADVLVEDKLFATLDSTTRTVFLNPNKKILLSDTVGFIRKLPHHLVASFRTTLEDVKSADLLLHVVDVSHPNFREHISIVQETLTSIDIIHRPEILVLNKIDVLPEDVELGFIKQEYPDAILISAHRGMNVLELKEKIIAKLEEEYIQKTWDVSTAHYQAISYIHQVSEVISISYRDDVAILTVRINKRHEPSVQRMIESLKEKDLYHS